MTKDQKILWLRQHAPESYAKARAKAEKELDALTPMFCVCGALATGLHTSHCKKFQERLKTIIIKELNSIIPTKNE